jgi:endoglucanase
MSVFDPDLTNAISLLMAEHERRQPRFRWQRKLMPGGTCEATAFGAYGYSATCLCLPLGNYHNMADIDGVAAGRRPAEVGPEFISLDDFHGLVEMLVVCATGLDGPATSLRARMDRLCRDYGHVLQQAPAAGGPAVRRTIRDARVPRQRRQRP